MSLLLNVLTATATACAVGGAAIMVSMMTSRRAAPVKASLVRVRRRGAGSATAQGSPSWRTAGG